MDELWLKITLTKKLMKRVQVLYHAVFLVSLTASEQFVIGFNWTTYKNNSSKQIPQLHKQYTRAVLSIFYYAETQKQWKVC